MREPGDTTRRSTPMMIAAYYLSRCGERIPYQHFKPPRALGVSTWKGAYDSFFGALGNGTTPAQFRLGMKRARTAFDAVLGNHSAGWMGNHWRRPSPAADFLRVHEEWKCRGDKELEAHVLGLRSGNSPVHEEVGKRLSEPTEGDAKNVLSRRPERDPRLRAQAILLHGLDCMACGFNFGDFYGKHGEGFIVVHHVVPLAQSGRRATNPETDLIVLCANCHEIVHRKKGNCMPLDELKGHIAEAGNRSAVAQES